MNRDLINVSLLSKSVLRLPVLEAGLDVGHPRLLLHPRHRARAHRLALGIGVWHRSRARPLLQILWAHSYMTRAWQKGLRERTCRRAVLLVPKKIAKNNHHMYCISHLTLQIANARLKADQYQQGSMLNYLCDCTNPDWPTNLFSFCTQATTQMQRS